MGDDETLCDSEQRSTMEGFDVWVPARGSNYDGDDGYCEALMMMQRQSDGSTMATMMTASGNRDGVR
ncbi:hypothetical protein F0562_025487 [Nyssa sinensis]|uniref:Uncharacterized protein n=1 Tax=Nyssa sinensis TaxID=561372 RepID=A0A5J5B6G4_9ASTE|nr:hypothetical protein F0562_025487 [Nyssa sinensis]